MKKIVFLFLVMELLFYPDVCAMGWKGLHEKADILDYQNAKAEANAAKADDIYVFALVCLNLHKDMEAEVAFRKILLTDPSSIKAKWGVAECLRRRHDIKKSQELLVEIIEIDPDFAPAYISLAYIKYLSMEFDEAVRLALRVIEKGQSGADLTNYVRALAMYAGAKGMIAHYGGVFSKAINGTAVKPNLDKAFKLQPNSPGVLFGLGSYYLLAPVIAGGDKQKAEIYLKKAIQVDPLFADAYVRLAQLYKIRNDNSKYSEFMELALKIDPGNELALDHQSGRCKFICVGGEEKLNR